MRWGAQIHPARDIFRHGMGPVIDALTAAGRIIGKTTSAAFGCRVGKPVLLALLDLAYCGTGRSVNVEVAGESFDGSVKSGAIFDDTARRLRPLKA